MEITEEVLNKIIVDYTINDDAEIVINTTLGIFYIPPHLFNKMIDEAIKKGYLSYSINLHRFSSDGGFDESLEFKMKPKTNKELRCLSLEERRLEELRKDMTNLESGELEGHLKNVKAERESLTRMLERYK